MAATSGLSSGLPGTIAGPESPPDTAEDRESSRSPPSPSCRRGSRRTARPGSGGPATRRTGPVRATGPARRRLGPGRGRAGSPGTPSVGRVEASWHRSGRGRRAGWGAYAGASMVSNRIPPMQRIFFVPLARTPGRHPVKPLAIALAPRSRRSRGWIGCCENYVWFRGVFFLNRRGGAGRGG